MERIEIINILNGMCERCIMKGILSTLDDVKELYDTFDRFRNNYYDDDEKYSSDIMYFYRLANELHDSGNTSLVESHSIFSAILAADNIDYVESNNHNVCESMEVIPPIVIDVESSENFTNQNCDDSVIGISDMEV